MIRKILLQHISEDEVHGHARRRTLVHGRTALQEYEILQLGDCGRALVLDGCIQSTEHEEELYHESLVFPAYALAPTARMVLCLGGANGGLLKQVLKFPELERVLLVDIDRELHEVSRIHLPHMHGETLCDPRVTIRFEDPGLVVSELARGGGETPFDLIIADLPDATASSYAARLFTRDYYDRVRQILGPRGVYVTPAGQAHFRHCTFLNRTLRTLSSSFAHVAPYTVTVPSLGVPWAFALASDGVELGAVTALELARRIEGFPSGSLLTYDIESHYHMFKLPKVLRSALAGLEPLITPSDMALVAVATRDLKP